MSIVPSRTAYSSGVPLQQIVENLRNLRAVNLMHLVQAQIEVVGQPMPRLRRLQSSGRRGKKATNRRSAFMVRIYSGNFSGVGDPLGTCDNRRGS